MKKLNDERGIIYGFLARAYRDKIDKQFIDAMSIFDYSYFSGESLIEEGFLMLRYITANISDEKRASIADAYTKIFTKAGSAIAGRVSPYESAYVECDRVRDEVIARYGAEMLERSGMFKEPEDHIAFEFEFMACLCEMAVKACDINDKDMADTYLLRQKEFFIKHLNIWVESLSNDLLKLSDEPFYKAIAKITKGMVIEERELFNQF